MDDKHRIKIGEPNYPVADVERVLVRKDEVFEVGDHDFTKFSMIPYPMMSLSPCTLARFLFS